MAPTTTHRNSLDTRCIHRRAILPSRIAEVWSTSVAILVAEALLSQMGGGDGDGGEGCGDGGANMWRLQVVFVRTFRAFLEYILPAGGSSAINITRGSNSPPNRRRGGRRRRGRIGRESNSFPSQPFLTAPSPPFLPPLSPFSILSRCFSLCPVFRRSSYSSSYIYLSLSILAKSVHIFCWKRLKWAISSPPLFILKILAIRSVESNYNYFSLRDIQRRIYRTKRIV